MASIYADFVKADTLMMSKSQTDSPSPSNATPPSYPPESLLTGLPYMHPVRCSPRLHQLKRAAQEVLKSLEENPNTNQWIVALCLTPELIDHLSDDQSTSPIGVSYRFSWEGATGLIKVVPGNKHESTTDLITRVVDLRLIRMGIVDPLQRQWGAATTYKPTTNKGKQGDQIFLPPSRHALPGQREGWPTFVIETSVSESLPRLREDAKWWLYHSDGAVRIVLVVAIRPSHVTFEKWQLAPANAPHPLTQRYIDGLRAQGSPPILITQPGPMKQTYSAHTVEVDANGIQGAPMVLEIDALYDGPPAVGLPDVVLDRNDFRTITSSYF